MSVPMTTLTTLPRKYVLLFLGLTFGLTWSLEALMIADGFDASRLLEPGVMLMLVGIMWIPGICGLLVNALAGNSLANLRLRFGGWKPYAMTIVLVPLLFAVSYGLTWLLDLGKPDWTMTSLLHDMRMAPKAHMPAYHALFIMLPASALLGPFFNFLAALGEEIGWRGFLLPALLPMGRIKAHLTLGTIWGLWHLPLVLVGFNYPDHPFAGILLMCLGTIAMGTFINEFALAWQSTLVAAFIHAAINAQAYGVWQYLFPKINPLLGGDTGLTGIICWSLTAMVSMKLLRTNRK
jgi:hypothetical protein